MTCEHVKIPGGVAIVFTRGGRTQRCPCGRRAIALCDWKLKGKALTKTGATRTCSAPLCNACRTNVGPEKDLCGPHARLWEKHPKNPKNVTREPALPSPPEVPR